MTHIRRLIRVLGIVTLLPALLSWVRGWQRRRAIRRRILKDGGNDYEGTARNIANSISMARELYKRLIARAHPDRFPEDKKERATELSARITQAKRNHERLLELEKELEAFLLEKG